MTNFKKMGGITALFVATLTLSIPAQAITLIGNYPFNNDNFGNLISAPLRSQNAIGFTLPDGSNYRLDSIRLRLEAYRTSDDVALLQVYEDPTNTSINPNSATLKSVLFNNPNSNSSNIANFNFIPTSTFTFFANVRYWLLVDATAGGFSWDGNNPVISPTGISGLTNIGYQLSIDNGSTYTLNPRFASFQIEVTPVPFEFNPTFGLGFLGGAWLIQKGLRKKV
jgi:hypothetical protein